jgi:hypothetical protein
MIHVSPNGFSVRLPGHKLESPRATMPAPACKFSVTGAFPHTAPAERAVRMPEQLIRPLGRCAIL